MGPYSFVVEYHLLEGSGSTVNDVSGVTLVKLGQNNGAYQTKGSPSLVEVGLMAQN
ncbi:MAG: hypothetical protein KUG73_07215 [Pseudomonadales bacterium]|nr:hypothetical protein [Pseudomonadales bacterium]